MPVECPKCNSDSISADNIELDGDIGYQNVVCNDCDFVWIEIWECTSWYAQDDESKTFKPDEKYSGIVK